jgi:APA family basic amino acid/polyamine antiporter
VVSTLSKTLMRIKPMQIAGSEAHGHGNVLKRSLGLFSLTMLGVGATIGTGIFFTMAEAVPRAGAAVVLSFLLASLTAGLTALCYAELASTIPASGSSYSYTYATTGELSAYIVAACLLLEYGLAASATAIGWSDYLNNFLHNAFAFDIPAYLRSPLIVSGEHGTEWHWGNFNLPPLILVILCGVLLLRGTKESATTNAVMVLIKLAILTFFVAIAITGFDAKNFTPFFNEQGMAGVASGAGVVFFSFIGLDTVATAGEETENPKRNVPLGILLALFVVTVAYMLVAVAAMGAQPAAEFKGQEAGLAVILEKVTGQKWPAILLSAGAVISVFSVTLVTIYGQTRILFAISRDGLIPEMFQKVHPRTLTPVNNTLVVCVGVGIVAALVDSTFLWDMVSMGTLVAFMLVSLGVIVLRYRAPDIKRGFSVPFGPWLVPLLSIASCIYILKDLPDTTFKIFGIWMLVALVIYFLYGRHHSRLNQSQE